MDTLTAARRQGCAYAAAALKGIAQHKCVRVACVAAVRACVCAARVACGNVNVVAPHNMLQSPQNKAGMFIVKYVVDRCVSTVRRGTNQTVGDSNPH